jgi:hypothetical protein
MSGINVTQGRVGSGPASASYVQGAGMVTPGAEMIFGTPTSAGILTLLNNEAAMYEAHRILVAGGVHGAVDGANVITATMPATNEAEAVALGVNLRAMYEAHRLRTTGGVHGTADSVNTIVAPVPTDWDSLVVFCNEFKNTTGFNAHLLLVGGPPVVHGAQDVINTVTAPNAVAPHTAAIAGNVLEAAAQAVGIACAPPVAGKTWGSLQLILRWTVVPPVPVAGTPDLYLVVYWYNGTNWNRMTWPVKHIDDSSAVEDARNFGVISDLPFPRDAVEFAVGCVGYVGGALFCKMVPGA